MGGSAEATPSRRHSSQPGPATVLAVAALGAAIGAGVLYADRPFPAEARAFTSTGESGVAIFTPVVGALVGLLLGS